MQSSLQQPSLSDKLMQLSVPWPLYMHMQAGTYDAHSLKGPSDLLIRCAASQWHAERQPPWRDPEGLPPIVSRDRIASAAHTIRLLTACTGTAYVNQACM